MLEKQKNKTDVRGAGIWEHFTMRDGLPDMKIECIFEDSRGVLWIGTHDRGVVRYEGDEFKPFTQRDGLSGDGVYSILEDQKGNLWFGTNQGLSRFDGEDFTTLNLEEPCSFLWGSCMDHEGRLWFGAEGRPGRPPAVCRWDGEKLELVYLTDIVQVQGQSINQVIVDLQGDLWCAGHSYNLYHYDGIVFQCIEILPDSLREILFLLPRKDGGLWISTNDGLYVFEEGKFNRVEQESGDHWFMALSKDPSGVIWMNTHDGRLLCYDGNAFDVIGKVDANFWRGLCLDRMGRLWISTYGMGLFCYNATRIRVYRVEQGLPANPVNCMAEDAEGNLWVGTREGLVGYDGHLFLPLKGTETFEDKEVTALLVDSNNRLWFGKRNGYQYIFEGGKIQSCSSVPEIIAYIISGLVEDRNGRVWFGSRHGKSFGYYEKKRVIYFPSKESADYPSWIGALEVDQEGNIWLGSSSPGTWDGLCRYDGVSFERLEGLSGSPILALCAARDSRLWIGTNEGLIYYDGEIFVSFTQEDGLSCDLVTAIVQAEDGTMWIGTEGGGVCCYDGKVIQVIQIPGEPGCNVVHALLQDRHGRLWWATEDGLVQYTPKRVQPEVEITEVVADCSYCDSEEVQFPTTVGRVGFCFRGRSPLEHSSYLVYRYRLDGYEDDWHQIRDRKVEYPQLKPGRYTFAVQAVDRDLNYSDTARVKLLVTEDPRIEALTEALRTETIKGEFIGESAALRKVKRQIQEVAWTDLTVLVMGETGTGKGLAARAIHELSERKDRPFLHINCGTLDRELVDSDLFGHERGAFTGAFSRRLGKFELADGGTIFLDEIGDLPLESQSRLLHVLQEHVIERVGGTQVIPVDVRVIVATNRDLVKSVREETFRADLYYRLNVFPIQIPPLRERKQDIPQLTRYFVRQFAAHLHQKLPFISEEAMLLLSGYDWPGNVRELEHTLQRGVILAGETAIGPEHIALGPVAPADAVGEEDLTILPLEEYERRYLVRVLKHTDGVIHGKRGAALLLGMKPTTLRSRLEKLGLKK